MIYVFFFFLYSGPFNQAITSHMLLKNPTDKPILFKIKTTAPKRYCVRPNSGLLEPNNFLEVGSKYCDRSVHWKICRPYVYDMKKKNNNIQ